MKKQIFNPYLPSWEYVPDGEPHIFGDRLYIFGSHDRFGGKYFCENDYVCWSAPLSDLSDWQYEGVIYRKDQARGNADGKLSMQAPDVAQGPDGRFYLYYTLMYKTDTQVAVCDTPTGQYEYYGTVCHPDGKPYGTKSKDLTSFDPAVLVDDDGRIWFYSGNSVLEPIMNKIGRFINNPKMRGLGGNVLELEQDMLTVKSVKSCIPGPENSAGTGFEGNEFFEASSIRKFDGKYYFIYSTIHSHDLCYAVSDKPDQGFQYGGRLLSNGNIGYQGQQEANCYWGNNHGSLIKIGEKYYIFGHRQTNANEHNRQGIAQEIAFCSGKFEQAELTSCGLNGGPLHDQGIYNAGIACILAGPEGSCKVAEIKDKSKVPYITQSGEDREKDPDQYIANILNGTKIGYKYFNFSSAEQLTLWVRGPGNGYFEVRTGEDGIVLGKLEVKPSTEWLPVSSKIAFPQGTFGLYLLFRGNGSTELQQFALK